MSGYGFLSGCYDELTTDVDYPRWADYLEKQFARNPRPVRTVLDLACGTGTLTCLLAERGYEMIGVDLSPDMLAEAAEKAEGIEGVSPMFLCQPMQQLDLYDTVDACVCCLDSINHITRPSVLRRVFERVHLFLSPGGLFVFDINTPEKLQGLDGGLFLDETEDAYCVWRAEYAPRRRICTFDMDVFRREGSHWIRGSELQEEYAYTAAELAEYLTAAGFHTIRLYGNLKMRPPKAEEDRIFFTARKAES